jgi:hypothetical protein
MRHPFGVSHRTSRNEFAFAFGEPVLLFPKNSIYR